MVFKEHFLSVVLAKYTNILENMWVLYSLWATSRKKAQQARETRDASILICDGRGEGAMRLISRLNPLWFQRGSGLFWRNEKLQRVDHDFEKQFLTHKKKSRS